MIDGIEIRRYSRNDEADAVSLLTMKASPAQREKAFKRRLQRWRWQYYENPNNPEGKPLIWLACLDGRTVGMIATIPVHLRTPGGLVDALWGVDLIVDRKARGKGIGRKLVDTWMRAAPVALGRGWSPAAYGACIKAGFEPVFGFTSTKLVISRCRLAGALAKTSRWRELARLAGVCSRHIPEPERSRPSPTSVSTEIPEGYERLWTDVAPAYRFSVERDRPYLNWRFINHPAHEYRFISLGGRGNLSGVAVTRLSHHNPPFGIVEDLITPPGDKRNVVKLLDETVGFLHSKGAVAAVVDLPPHLATVILGRYGCSMTEDLGMLIHTRDEELEAASIFSADAWYLSRSDTDEDY